MIPARKVMYEVSAPLRQYLYRFDRLRDIPRVYWELTRFSGAVPYEDPHGRETLWLTVMYSPEVIEELRPRLIRIYSELKLGRDAVEHEHLLVDRIDFGDFGNSKPFRVRVTNLFNDNSDYFYVKQADSSRIYGLELEHILSRACRAMCSCATTSPIQRSTRCASPRSLRNSPSAPSSAYSVTCAA
jgi:hypothetical protein